MAGKSDYWEDAINDYIFRGTAIPAVTTHIGLSTTTPAEDGTGVTEPVAMGYARQALTTTEFNTGSSAGTIANAGAAITFPTATGNWGTITHFVIYDALSAGNLLYFDALSSGSVTVNTNDVARFAINALTITEA